MFDERAHGGLFEGAFSGFEVRREGCVDGIILEFDGDGAEDFGDDGDGVSAEEDIAGGGFCLIAAEFEGGFEFGEILFNFSGFEQLPDGFVLIERGFIVIDEGGLRGGFGVIDVLGERFCEVDEAWFEVSHLSGEGLVIFEDADEGLTDFAGDLDEAFSVEGDVEGGEVRAI